MMKLDEIIKHVEQVAYNNNDEALVCMGIKEYRELAGLLRELQERRQKDNKKRRGNARWLINSDGYYPYCSDCMAEPEDGKMTDFCPSCGARMEGKIT